MVSTAVLLTACRGSNPRGSTLLNSDDSSGSGHNAGSDSDSDGYAGAHHRDDNGHSGDTRRGGIPPYGYALEPCRPACA